MTPLEEQVATILSRYSYMINFIYGDIYIKPERLRVVGELIGKGLIKVEYAASGDPPLPAFYDDPTDTMKINKRYGLNSVLNASNVIHEGVHAYNDYQQMNVAREDDEGAAYVAQAIFLQNKGYSSAPTTGDAQADAIMAVAYKIGYPDLFGYYVSKEDIESMRKALLGHETYRNSIDGTYKYRYWGIKGT